MSLRSPTEGEVAACRCTNTGFLSPWDRGPRKPIKAIILTFVLPCRETVSQCYKSPGCHAERERSICFSDTLRKADSSPAAQNDIVTQPQKGKEQRAVAGRLLHKSGNGAVANPIFEGAHEGREGSNPILRMNSMSRMRRANTVDKGVEQPSFFCGKTHKRRQQRGAIR